MKYRIMYKGTKDSYRQYWVEVKYNWWGFWKKLDPRFNDEKTVRDYVKMIKERDRIIEEYNKTKIKVIEVIE